MTNQATITPGLARSIPARSRPVTPSSATPGSATSSSARPSSATPSAERAPRLLARAWFRELRQQGFTEGQIRAFGAEIMDMATPLPAEVDRAPRPR